MTYPEPHNICEIPNCTREACRYLGDMQVCDKCADSLEPQISPLVELYSKFGGELDHVNAVLITDLGAVTEHKGQYYLENKPIDINDLIKLHDEY